MQSLGVKEKNMYGPEMATTAKNETRYPDVRLPGKFARDNDIEVGDEVTMTIKGKVTGICNDKYSDTVTIELNQGEVTEHSEDASEGSLLQKAK